jgi:hypothetical protein
MPPSYVHESSDHGAEVADRNDAGREDRPSSVRITVIVQIRLGSPRCRGPARELEQLMSAPDSYRTQADSPSNQSGSQGME